MIPLLSWGKPRDSYMRPILFGVMGLFISGCSTSELIEEVEAHKKAHSFYKIQLERCQQDNIALNTIINAHEETDYSIAHE